MARATKIHYVTVAGRTLCGLIARDHPALRVTRDPGAPSMCGLCRRAL